MSARLALALCALVTLLPANAALAEEPAQPASEQAESDAATAPVEETEEASTPAPAAKPAQSDDYGAPHQYIEEGVPDGTGDAEAPAPVDDTDSGDTQSGSPAPQPQSQPQPSAGAVPVAEVASDAGNPGDLPRTGPASLMLALTGLLLLALGFLARRIAAAEPSA